MRRPLALLLLSAALAVPPAHAGTATLLHAPAPRPAASLLLVLEAGPDGVAVRDARVAPIRTKAAHAPAAVEADGLLLALTDAAGEPLVVAEVAVPWMLHGPYLDEDGALRCRGERQERVTFGVRLPLPPGAESLVVAERGAASPAEAADLVRAFRARPADFGLVVRGGGRLAELPRLPATAGGPP